MTRYVASRLAQLVLVFFGVTLLIYLAVYVLPGDPIRAMAGDRPLPDSVVHTLRARYHLDDPVFVRYFRYLGGLLTGDLGTDFTGRPVATLMAQRWPVTATLALTAWALEVVLGLVAGTFAALHRGRTLDRVILLLSVLAISVPVFVLGYTAQLVFGVRLGLFPVAGTGHGWPMGYLLPALVLAVIASASVTRLVRAGVLENLGADHVRTAVAKGLPWRRVVTRHVLRNSLPAAVTYLAVDLGFLLGGTVIIESIFNLPGVGQLLFQSIGARQGAVVVGVATALVLVFLLLNLVVDLLYGVLDPRIRRA
ncbi:ABC transporter permease [Amycolatopsis sacchari]|uniref:ABC transporter permease n=1 Tax=Amycolatopsis sacchari TaxID=115433 RepID=UPI003EBE0A96